MLGFFATGTPVSVTDFATRHYHPRWLDAAYLDSFIRARRPIEEFESLLSFIEAKRPKSILFLRDFALGDILMLIPLARALHRRAQLTNPIIIAISRRFLPSLRGLDQIKIGVRFIESRGLQDYRCDVHVNLNKCLEPDHHGGDASNIHRCGLYARAMGLEI